MYKNKLVVCLKKDDKVLREQNETVKIPFGEEFSILIKNLNSVRALVKIEIDGQDIGNGIKFIINPNSDFNIERYITNGNLSEGNRFKFIERTSKIENYRGIKAEDGLVRVEFQFEKITQVVLPYYYDHTWQYPPYYGYPPYYVSSQISPFMRTLHEGGLPNGIPYASSVVNDENNIGITVPGSISSQEFIQGESFSVENEKHIIILKLLGETECGKRITHAVTVKKNQKCQSCGYVNNNKNKFCAECGTSLEII